MENTWEQLKKREHAIWMEEFRRRHRNDLRKELWVVENEKNFVESYLRPEGGRLPTPEERKQFGLFWIKRELELCHRCITYAPYSHIKPKKYSFEQVYSVSEEEIDKMIKKI